MLSYIICFTLNKIGQDSSQQLLINLYVKVKAIPVTSRGSPLGCETSRLPQFLDNRLTDGGKVVSLKRRPPLPPGRFLILISVRGCVDPRATVRLKVLDPSKNPVTSSGCIFIGFLHVKRRVL
jgi:hypothetical protein